MNQIPIIIEKILYNLSTISKIKIGDKLLTRDAFLSIDKHIPIISSAYRKYYGEDSEKTSNFICDLIDYTLEYIRVLMENKYFDIFEKYKNSDQTGEFYTWYTQYNNYKHILLEIYNKISTVPEGLANLLITYSNENVGGNITPRIKKIHKIMEIIYNFIILLKNNESANKWYNTYKNNIFPNNIIIQTNNIYLAQNNAFNITTGSTPATNMLSANMLLTPATNMLSTNMLLTHPVDSHLISQQSASPLLSFQEMPLTEVKANTETNTKMNMETNTKMNMETNTKMNMETIAETETDSNANATANANAIAEAETETETIELQNNLSESPINSMEMQNDLIETIDVLDTTDAVLEKNEMLGADIISEMVRNRSDTEMIKKDDILSDIHDSDILQGSAEFKVETSINRNHLRMSLNSFRSVDDNAEHTYDTIYENNLENLDDNILD